MHLNITDIAFRRIYHIIILEQQIQLHCKIIFEFR